MAPSRARPVDDPKQPDGSRDRTGAGITKPKSRVNNIMATAGVHKDNISPVSSNAPSGPSNGLQLNIAWASQPEQLLNSYRIAHKLEAPSSFISTLNAAVLTAPGIGRRSPTMMKQRERKKIPKEQLALAVRKHSNGLAVNESDVLVDFIYAVRNQDRKFKMRFNPGKK